MDRYSVVIYEYLQTSAGCRYSILASLYNAWGMMVFTTVALLQRDGVVVWLV